MGLALWGGISATLIVEVYGEAYVPAMIEGALSHVCWTSQSWFAELHCTWFRG